MSYRLIVVEDNGQSPETLIQSALGTSPTLDNGSFAGGTLLDYEIVDARTSDANFTMPPSGVQNLESGQKYYWQVFTNRQGVSTTESIPSEIWEFRLASNETNVAANLNQEVFNSLSNILTPAQLNQLMQQGYNFISITVDGQTYEGASAVQKLLEMSNKIENDEITIVSE
ncbi:MAG: hypothetical protein U5K69_15475 [Balneolaceae bacterium]|nr:hypothetical protein [Balneolaceae bacterium]